MLQRILDAVEKDQRRRWAEMSCGEVLSHGRGMALQRWLAWPALDSSVASAVALSCRFAARFFEPIGEHGFGVIGGPLVGQHLVEARVVTVQAQEQLAQDRSRVRSDVSWRR